MISKQKCFLLLKKYNYPQYKLIHAKLVAKLAKYLGKELKKKGKPINTDLVYKAGLLHDIDKAVPKAEKTHPQKGVEILKKEHLNNIAEIVKKHSLPAILDRHLKPYSWEEKVLFLADKMVKNKIITIEERFKLWQQENIAELNKLLEKTYPKVQNLQTEIFTIIEKTPKEIISKLANIGNKPANLRRLFIAINPDQQIKQEVKKKVLKLKKQMPNFRFVPTNNLHLTLSFIGKTNLRNQQILQTIILKTAKLHSQFQINTKKHLGIFQKGENLILLLGIMFNPKLITLKKGLDKMLKAEGFPVEERPFNAHITVARGKKRNNKKSWNKLFKKINSQLKLNLTIQIKNLSLMESKLSSKGTNYYELFNSLLSPQSH